MNSIEKIKGHRFALLWSIIILIFILVFATTGILTAVWLDKFSKSPNVISVSPDESEVAQTDYFKYIYRRVPIDPQASTLDTKAQWETTTKVDLFKDSYMNKDGVITVKSDDGSKIIAPGTSNSYYFVIKNTGNVVLTYSLQLRGMFELSDEALPFTVRLDRDNVYVVGSDDEWCDIDDLSDYEESGTLDVGKTVTFTLEWQWPFEADVDDMKFVWDENDTQIGSTATVDLSNSFILSIETTAEEIPGAVAVDEDGNPIYEKVKDIDGRIVAIPLAAAGALGIGWIIILLAFRHICVTGFVPAGYAVRYKRKKDTVRSDGRFVFANVKSGRNTFELLDANDNVIATWKWKLKRKHEFPKLEIEYDKQGPSIVTVESDVRAIELHFDIIGNSLVPSVTDYATLNKHKELEMRGVVTKPDENGGNVTPCGLMIDKNKHLSFTVDNITEPVGKN